MTTTGAPAQPRKFYKDILPDENPDDRAYRVSRVQSPSTPPPTPVDPVPPQPASNAVWVPGYWDWRGHRHVWVRGAWVKERRGYFYHPHRWVERNGGWYLDRGRGHHDALVEAATDSQENAVTKKETNTTKGGTKWTSRCKERSG